MKELERNYAGIKIWGIPTEFSMVKLFKEMGKNFESLNIYNVRFLLGDYRFLNEKDHQRYFSSEYFSNYKLSNFYALSSETEYPEENRLQTKFFNIPRLINHLKYTWNAGWDKEVLQDIFQLGRSTLEIVPIEFVGDFLDKHFVYSLLAFFGLEPLEERFFNGNFGYINGFFSKIPEDEKLLSAFLILIKILCYENPKLNDHSNPIISPAKSNTDTPEIMKNEQKKVFESINPNSKNKYGRWILNLYLDSPNSDFIYYDLGNIVGVHGLRINGLSTFGADPCDLNTPILFQRLLSSSRGAWNSNAFVGLTVCEKFQDFTFEITRFKNDLSETVMKSIETKLNSIINSFIKKETIVCLYFQFVLGKFFLDDLKEDKKIEVDMFNTIKNALNNYFNPYICNGIVISWDIVKEKDGQKASIGGNEKINGIIPDNSYLYSTFIINPSNIYDSLFEKAKNRNVHFEKPFKKFQDRLKFFYHNDICSTKQAEHIFSLLNENNIHISKEEGADVDNNDKKAAAESGDLDEREGPYNIKQDPFYSHYHVPLSPSTFPENKEPKYEEQKYMKINLDGEKLIIERDDEKDFVIDFSDSFFSRITKKTSFDENWNQILTELQSIIEEVSYNKNEIRYMLVDGLQSKIDYDSVMVKFINKLEDFVSKEKKGPIIFLFGINYWNEIEDDKDEWNDSHEDLIIIKDYQGEVYDNYNILAKNKEIQVNFEDNALKVANIIENLSINTDILYEISKDHSIFNIIATSRETNLDNNSKIDELFPTLGEYVSIITSVDEKLNFTHLNAVSVIELSKENYEKRIKPHKRAFNRNLLISMEDNLIGGDIFRLFPREFEYNGTIEININDSMNDKAKISLIVFASNQN